MNFTKAILFSFPVLCLMVLNQFSDSAQSEKKPVKVLRHVVMFKFNESVSEAQIKEVEQAFAALPGKIDTIDDFEWGTDVSVENKSKGLTHCFVVTFANEKGRATYLPHAAHLEFVKLVGPRLADVCVIDYWATR